MATSLKELIVTYEANAKPVLDALNQIDAKIKQTSAQLKTTSDAFLTAGRDIGLALSVPLGLLSMKALKASADFESLKMQMEVLTGSAEEGDRVFRRLVQFAAETPFELTQLAKATNTLMGFGETADDADKHLRLIGDVAAVSGGDFQGITVAFGQVSAAGRMMGQDLLQLVNNGVPALDMLAKSMGVPKTKIKDMVSEGKVTFPVLVRAFEQATSKGGMFENGMIKLSKTSKGVYSTFKDNVNIALANFGDEMQKAFKLTDKLEALGKWIGKLSANFSRLAPETKKTVMLFVAFAVVIGPLLVLIGTLIRLLSFAALGFSFLMSPIRWLISAFPILMGVARAFMMVFAANPLTAFIAATIAIIYYWKEIVQLFKDAWDWISKISVTGMWDKVKDFAGSITAKISGGAESAISSPASNISNMSNQKTVNNNLVVNIPSGTTSADSGSIKSAIKAALAEENRQAYIEAGAQ